jgi:Amt family ammonium transporter
LGPNPGPVNLLVIRLPLGAIGNYEIVVNLFTLLSSRGLLLLVCLSLVSGILPAQTETNAPAVPDPTQLEAPGASSLPLPETSAAAPPAAPAAMSAPLPAPAPLPVVSPTPTPVSDAEFLDALEILGAVIILAAWGGFLLYQTGQTRAKNCGHTSVLLLIGVVLGLTGYWMGGFAVQTGGVGDAHAALAAPLASVERGALDHELGPVIAGHHWGFMGSAGFFLITDDAARDTIAALFLTQAVFVVLAVAAALGAALERGRLRAMAVLAFLAGAVIYPLVANWIWGGGWLAELGREFGLGHGVIDLAGAGVVHETAGTLALAIALVLGPRYGRFQRNKVTGIPGHNVPFTILGALILLVVFIATGACASSGASAETATARAGLASTNVLLGAIGAMLVSILLGAWRQQRARPARLTRGLLGGAVSLCGGAALFDSWAAFLIGVCAGLLVEGVTVWLEWRQIDDPAGATAIHGAGGAWGLLATGFFANGTAGRGLNGVDGPVRGLFFGGAWHQLAAQVIGCAADFVVVFVLGYLAALGVQKILGSRVKLTDELQGLDWPQVGALGYQPDVESGEDERQWHKLG